MPTVDLQALLQDPDAHEEGLIWVDHREEEEAIVAAVAEALQDGDDLDSEWRDDVLVVIYQQQEHEIPLTFSPHDRYVAISSLAEMLAANYEFWIQRDSLDGDTHGLLVASRAALAALVPAERKALEASFQPLELGHDYFHGLRVPYLGHLDHNPHLARESAKQAQASKALVDSVLNSGEMQGVLQTMKARLARLMGGGRK